MVYFDLWRENTSPSLGNLLLFGVIVFGEIHGGIAQDGSSSISQQNLGHILQGSNGGPTTSFLHKFHCGFDFGTHGTGGEVMVQTC